MTDDFDRRGPVKAPQDLAAGLFLIALALFALWLGWRLNPGTMRAMGPGMVPRIVAVMMALIGFALVAGAFLRRGPPIDALSLRGPLFISLAIVAFGLTVRGFPLPGGVGRTPALGLLGAGPLAIMISGFASPETRWPELALFAAVMTTFCWLLFSKGLGLPIPLLPVLLGY
jgi:hypothetical protein